MMRLFWIVTTLILLIPVAHATNVHYIIPASDESHPFWKNTLPIANESAAQLGFSLSIHFTAEDRFSYFRHIKNIAEQQKPKFVIIRVVAGNAAAIFDYLEAHKIYFVTFESSYTNAERDVIGTPQKNYKYWLSEILTDDYKASKTLLNSTLNKQKLNKVIALGGSWGAVSTEREKALLDTCIPHNQCQLLRTVKTHWDKRQALPLLDRLYESKLTADIIWTVGSEIALTSRHFFESKQQNPQIITFDWSQTIFAAIQVEKVTATAGGHFIFPALALLNIYQFKHLGLTSVVPYQIKLEIISKTNVNWVNQTMINAKWQALDFKSLATTSKSTTSNQSALEWLKMLRR